MRWWCRRCAGPGHAVDHRPHVVGGVSGQGLPSRVALPRTVRKTAAGRRPRWICPPRLGPISATRRPGRSRGPPVQGQPGRRARTTWAPRSRTRTGPAGSGSGAPGRGPGRGVQHRCHPGRAGPGLAKLDRCGGQGGHRLERGQGGERHHRQRDPGQRAGPGGGHRQAQHRPHGQPGGAAGQAGPQAHARGRPAFHPGQPGAGVRGPGGGGLLCPEGVQVRRAGQDVGEVGGELAPRRGEALAGPAGPGGGQPRDQAPAASRPPRAQPRRREDEQARDHRTGPAGRRPPGHHAPQEQVLGGIHVADQPRQRHPAQRAQPGGASRSSRWKARTLMSTSILNAASWLASRSA